MIAEHCDQYQISPELSGQTHFDLPLAATGLSPSKRRSVYQWRFVPQSCFVGKFADNYLPDVTFGEATNSLANAIGGAGTQYTPGGARSMQFALKLFF
jgi:hypothetical protein